MKFTVFAGLLGVTLLTAGFASAEDSPDQKREKTRKMAASTLKDLYKLQPASKTAIQNSAGYAIFDNLGTKILLVSTARGGGMAVNSKTGTEIFMKMISLGAGIGIGVKGYRVIFVFENESALTKFLDSGWEASGEADAAAKVKESGGAYAGSANVAPGVWAYEITKNGLALQLTIQGTKYSRDKDLSP